MKVEAVVSKYGRWRKQNGLIVTSLLLLTPIYVAGGTSECCSETQTQRLLRSQRKGSFQLRLFLSLCGPTWRSVAPLNSIFGFENSCYERVYSEDHLTRHPGQRVSQIRFDHFPKTYGTVDESGNVNFDPATAEVYFLVSLKYRGSNETFSDGGFCYPEGQLYRCQIECDGGGFYLQDRDSDSILLLNKRGFRISGCASGAERVLDPHPDDGAFRLDRLPDRECIPPEYALFT